MNCLINFLRIGNNSLRQVAEVNILIITKRIRTNKLAFTADFNPEKT